MALDGLVIHAIVHELQSCVGGRINKIHQPSEHDIIFYIRAQGQNIKLLLSSHPTYPRVHITEESFINPIEAPMFCMLLRKHCENGMIESIQQVGTERILHIDIRQRDELGDVRVKRFVVEIMGRHSNLILMDPHSRIIYDGIKHVTPAISTHRIILPGSTYVNPPEQEKINPLTASDESILSIFEESLKENHTIDNGHTAQQIVNMFSGVSPLVAREIIYQGGNKNQGIVSAFIETMARIRNHQYEPTIVEAKSDGKMYFSVIPLTHISGESQVYSSVSLCLEAFYGDKAARDTVKQRVADLLKFIQTEKNKNHKKISKLNETYEKAKNADEYRVIGELLTASLHQVQRGDKQIEVINYYDPEQKSINIPLDSKLSPSENAQHYFKKYNKSKSSLSVVQEQIESTKQEIIYMDSLQQQLDDASLSDIEEIREELIEQGYIRNRAKKQHKKKKKKFPQLLCYISSEGIPIYVGKNNTQNEYLTNRLAHASDTWLHTKDIPGSHVVIRSNHFGENTLEEAALLASYYSQARESSQVPVDYTLIRHVRKPSGSKPGYVIYEQQKTLFITPDEQRIKQMKFEIK